MSMQDDSPEYEWLLRLQKHAVRAIAIIILKYNHYRDCLQAKITNPI